MKYPDFPDINVPDFLEDWTHTLEYNCENPSSTMVIGDCWITVFFNVTSNFVEYPLYEIHLDGSLYAVETADNDEQMVNIVHKFMDLIEKGEK